jgi:tetratricopeptide (TPR) repeat protein
MVLTLAAFAASGDSRAVQDPNALARIGIAAIDDQRFGDALDAFMKAAALRPNDANISFGAGVAAFMLGKNDAAQAHFERALALNPGHLQAAIWLGDLQYRAGRLREAIAIYESARRQSPDNRELADLVASVRKEQALQSRFRDVRSDRFIVLFEAAADEPLARMAIERLEAAYVRVGDALGLRPSRPITVVLYTREQYADITKLAAWSVAAYDGRIRVPLGGALHDRDELDRVLSHEFVHAVVAMAGGRNVPAWLNEGLATVLEPAGADDAETPARANARPSVSKLHGSFTSFSRRDAEIAYASSARAVKNLIDQRGAAAVVALLEDLARGAVFTHAFERRLAMRYEDFTASVR